MVIDVTSLVVPWTVSLQNLSDEEDPPSDMLISLLLFSSHKTRDRLLKSWGACLMCNKNEKPKERSLVKKASAFTYTNVTKDKRRLVQYGKLGERNGLQYPHEWVIFSLTR